MSFINRFFRDASSTHVNGDDTINRSYQHFVRYFSGREKLSEHDVIIGCHFTYGWMPTMLDLRGDLQRTIELLNRVKTLGCRLTTEEIKAIASNVNGSVVGTSKLLHFIRPDIHAIWDSRVYRYFHEKEPYIYRLEAPDAYASYLDQLRELSKDVRFPRLKQRLEKEIGYQVSSNRIGEYVMYHNGGKKA